ncbi:MAG: dihydrofolate reductase family protein [Mariprofundus sp.]|nr:dihydrofolate reductase family protein [Mariprofundus sp.]
MDNILQLYPIAQRQRALKGLYLELNLCEQAAVGDVLIYSNYIASVDGRISLRDDDSAEFVVPEAIANKRDWRLYQELAAQSDVMLTSARYFRQLADGKAQDLLPVGSAPEYDDLSEWRQQHGLKDQPDVIVISNSLDIPAAALEKVQDRRVIICTSERAGDAQIGRMESMGLTVLGAGRERVEGKQLRRLLIDQSFRSAYMIAGPEVHRTLVADGVLDYLFLTTQLSLLGHDTFHTILSGQLDQPVDLHLQRLYLDETVSSRQLFAQFALHPD